VRTDDILSTARRFCGRDSIRKEGAVLFVDADAGVVAAATARASGEAAGSLWVDLPAAKCGHVHERAVPDIVPVK
jgi:hypothetical protein